MTFQQNQDCVLMDLNLPAAVKGSILRKMKVTKQCMPVELADGSTEELLYLPFDLTHVNAAMVLNHLVSDQGDLVEEVYAKACVYPDDYGVDLVAYCHDDSVSIHLYIGRYL